MNDNRIKLIAMLFTFIVLILATPFIFDKLMNSKFNTMLIKVQQQNGIVIKEIENKSNYLNTDKVYEVVIPGEVLGSNEIKYIKLLTEVKFKNLPVTNVIFHNIVKKFVLKNGKEVKFLENNFVFDVITPDFKHYKYKVVDKKVKENSLEISWAGFNGECIYPKECKNEDGNISIVHTVNNSKISLIGIKSAFLKEKNRFEQTSSLKKFAINAPNTMVEINDISSKNIKIDKQNKVDITSELKVKNANANNVLKIDNAYSKVEFKDINKSAFNVSDDEKRLQIILDSGFRGDANLDIKNIFFMQPLGFLKADSNFSVKPGKNLEKLQYGGDLDFINLDATIIASKNLASLLLVSNPQLASLVKIDKDKAIIKIKIYRGKIYINGKEIKSN